MQELFCTDKPDILVDKPDTFEGTERRRRPDGSFVTKRPDFSCPATDSRCLESVCSVISAPTSDTEQYIWALREQKKKSPESEEFQGPEQPYFRG